MKKFAISFHTLAFILTFQSCKKDPVVYDVPATYNFSNADYSGQTKRLAMIEELVDAVKAGNAGTVLNATTLKNMYRNIGNPFGADSLNISGLQLKDKTFIDDQATVETWIDNAA